MSTSFITLVILLIAGALFVGCGKTDDRMHVEYTTPDGKKTSDVNAIDDGRVSYQLVREQKVPAIAEQLHREARAKGESGDYASALNLLRQASQVAPSWAYPYYDMAFTYLLQRDWTGALLNYRKVDQLEPQGFFTAKTALWTLEREEQGVFPRGTYLDYVSLEWTEPERAREMIERWTTNLPAFAPAWKKKALLTDDTDQRLKFFEKALSLDPDAETYGICMLNKAALLHISGKEPEAQRMLEELIRSDTSTVKTKALAKDVLKGFKK